MYMSDTAYLQLIVAYTTLPSMYVHSDVSCLPHIVYYVAINVGCVHVGTYVATPWSMSDTSSTPHFVRHI